MGRGPWGAPRGSSLILGVALGPRVAPGWAAEGATAPPLAGVETLGQVFLSLALVVALLLALAWALRRLNRLQPPGAGGLRLIGGISVGARERVLLVEAEGRRLLVGVSPGGLRTLLVLEGPAPADAKGPGSGVAGLHGVLCVPSGRAG